MADSDEMTKGFREEKATRNLSALSVFYGFIFIFTGALSNLSIYIAENRPELQHPCQGLQPHQPPVVPGLNLRFSLQTRKHHARPNILRLQVHHRTTMGSCQN